MSQEEDGHLAARLYAAAARLPRILRQEDGGGILPPSRLSALAVVDSFGPLSLASLADAVHVRPPTMSRIVDALVEAGLVTRDLDPANRRSVRIAATAAGTRLLETRRAQQVHALIGRLESLTDYERRALARGVEILDRITR